MSSQAKEACAAAVAEIENDIAEGLIGTRHVGFHISIFSLTTGELVYERGFGAERSRGGAAYIEVAHAKAELVLEHRRSLSALMEEGRETEMHNGGFIDGDIVVAVAGAGHLGNVSYGRRVLRHLLETLPR